MRHAPLARPSRLTRPLAALAVTLVAVPCLAQTPTPTPAATPAAQPASHAGHGAPAAPAAASLSPADIATLARVTAEMAEIRDSTQKRLSLVRNKTPEHQDRLREEAAAEVAALLKRENLTVAEYRRRTYLVSTDATMRRQFDESLGKASGGAAEGQTAAAPAAPAAMEVTLPAGPVGAHLGHIMQSFPETPMSRGLLATALAEAQVAAQHAALAGRDPNNLDAMKLHAAHVLHAIDPTAVEKGPGLGYGVKRAAQGIAQHVELAGAVEGAPAGVGTHANHVATAARSASRRADEVVALVKKIQEAGSASDAAGLVSQLVSLTTEITAGRDADANGRIGWQAGEGGLQQADEHLRLLIKEASAAAP